MSWAFDQPTDRLSRRVVAGVALGSNIGPCLDNLQKAVEFLRSLHEGIPDDFLVSSWIETSPVGCAPGTPNFLNGAAQLETSLPPITLLHQLQSFEAHLGRPARRPKNSPRPIDLDLLYHGDSTSSGEPLTLPHPRILERDFVLAPLAEIVPNLILPGTDKSVAQHLANLRSQSGSGPT